MSFKSTTDVLNQSRLLQKFLWSSKHIESIRVAWQLSVASNLRAHSVPTSLVEGNLLKVKVSSATWATRIRLQQKEILKSLNSIIDRPIYRIDCYISDDMHELNQRTKPNESREAYPFSKNHLKQTEALLATANHPDLIEALESLRTTILESLNEQ